MIVEALGHAQSPLPDPEVDRLLNLFLAYYEANIARESRAFPGAVEAISTLAASGARLAVCTNKRTDLSIQLLRALDLELRFSAIVGADSVTHKKPHPDHFRETVARAGGVVRASVMVGDSAPDVASAKAAGAPAVVVTFGYSEVPVEKLGADAILEDYADAVPILTRLLRPAG
jgi:phosphoglycolate phosphatase